MIDCKCTDIYTTVPNPWHSRDANGISPAITGVPPSMILAAPAYTAINRINTGHSPLFSVAIPGCHRAIP